LFRDTLHPVKGKACGFQIPDDKKLVAPFWGIRKPSLNPVEVIAFVISE
jgi:hypothetical protein